jgi:hypothetical protein
MIWPMDVLAGTKKANCGRERVYSVSQVTKKWKAAKVSWASFRDGSEKMALLVNTYCKSVKSANAKIMHT